MTKRLISKDHSVNDDRELTSPSGLTERPALPILGLHHVTAIARDPQKNVDFYAGLLGLRWVKKTVNFDDPGTYHLYYGDGQGSPGSIMTFFPWPGARLGRQGTGVVEATAFSVPTGSLGFWSQRLTDHGVEASESTRFGHELLRFRDDDGLILELVASSDAGDERPAWTGADVPEVHAVRGFDGVTLRLADVEASRALLVELMGFREVEQAGNRTRLESGDGGSGTWVDLLHDPSAPRALGGAGTVHHVAFRNADDPSQEEWRQFLACHLVAPTDVKDRQYFHSIYFREPGGVLFELATDPPGFAVDEPADQLGRELKLPPWLEPSRNRIEKVLPALTLKGSEQLSSSGVSS